ncbi:MAG: hypothetical protein IJU33_01740 [Bacteroidales bacterium]|nr:hypothetical protein [Bacteroidales bacterium]
MSDFRSFIKKNLTIYHIIGMVVGVALSIVYWYKSGQFSDNILKNNLALIILWGLLVGYITFDLIRNSAKKM